MIGMCTSPVWRDCGKPSKLYFPDFFWVASRDFRGIRPVAFARSPRVRGQPHEMRSGYLVYSWMCEKISVKLHISDNFVAYRVPANFSIYAKKHYHYTVIYFLTDLQKVSSLENHITWKSVFATSHESVFCRESNGKWSFWFLFLLHFL